MDAVKSHQFSWILDGGNMVPTVTTQGLLLLQEKLMMYLSLCAETAINMVLLYGYMIR